MAIEKELENIAMHYASKSGRLMGLMTSIEATLETIEDDRSNVEWAIKRIQNCTDRAKAIEKEEID